MALPKISLAVWVCSLIVGTVVTVAIVATSPVQVRSITDIDLGLNNAGEPFEDFKVTLARLNDTVLDLPADESLRAIGVSQLRPMVVAVGIDTGRSIRLRSTRPIADQNTVDAVHRFIAQRVISDITQRHTKINRARMIGEMKVLESNVGAYGREIEASLRAKAQLDRSYADVIRSTERLQGEMLKLKSVGGESAEANGTEPSGTPVGPDKNESQSGQYSATSELVRSNLLSRLEVLRQLDIPKMRAQLEIDAIRLVRQKARAEADLGNQKIDLGRWREPRIVFQIQMPQSGFSIAPMAVATGLLAMFLILGIVGVLGYYRQNRIAQKGA